MANELQYSANPSTSSGLTITARVYDNAGAQVGSDVACSEVGSLALYLGDMPTAPQGEYLVRFFDAASMVGQGLIFWDGTAEVNQLSVNVNVSSRSTFDPASDTVARVTLVDVTTLNSDMRGTDGAPSSTDIYSEFTASNNADAFKSSPDVNVIQVGGVSVSSPSDLTDQMTEAELHAGLDSYANKDDWKADSVTPTGTMNTHSIAGQSFNSVMNADATNITTLGENFEAVTFTQKGLSGASIDVLIQRLPKTDLAYPTDDTLSSRARIAINKQDVTQKISEGVDAIEYFVNLDDAAASSRTILQIEKQDQTFYYVIV
jgi:hypothetical protein